MNILETEWWSIAIPPEWWTDRDEDGILIGDRDEVGSIEISTLCRESGEFSSADLQQIVKDNGPEFAEAGKPFKSIRRGDFEGLVASYTEDDAALREWYITAGGVLLFITYSCDLENVRMDDAAVDAILDTLLLAATADD